MTEKKEQKKQQRRIVMKDIAEYVGWYTLLFALVSAGVFVWFIKNQKSFCWTTDTSSQYIPKASYFIEGDAAPASERGAGISDV